MLISILIATIIFGYATYTLWRFFQRSKQGKCVKCDIKNTCKVSTCGYLPEELQK